MLAGCKKAPVHTGAFYCIGVFLCEDPSTAQLRCFAQDDTQTENMVMRMERHPLRQLVWAATSPIGRGRWEKQIAEPVCAPVCNDREMTKPMQKSTEKPVDFALMSS